MFFANISLKTKAIQKYNSNESPDNIVTITDKQIVTNYSSNNGHGSSTQDYIIFTNKGTYSCGGMFNELDIYGQLQINHKYEIWTSPTLDFQIEANIVKCKELK